MNFSASLEETTDYSDENCRVAVRVFERYSYLGKNRLSLNVTMIKSGAKIFVSAITAGGSQALFFKVNTWGEEYYLAFFTDIISPYVTTRN